MAKMTGFIFQDEYLERLAKLSDQEIGRLVRALSKYHATGETQELAGRESIAYDFIKVDIDRIDQKYEARCETNRNNRERSSTNDNEREQPITNVVQDKDKVKVIVKDNDKEKDKGESNTRHFVAYHPPTVDEVASYCREKGYKIDAEHFVSYYESNGWKVGRNPMKDWKAACRTWARNEYSKPTQGKAVAQTSYEQREYEDRKPGEIPAWLREELEKEAAG